MANTSETTAGTREAELFLFEDTASSEDGIAAANGQIKGELKGQPFRWHGQFNWHDRWRNGNLIQSDERFQEALTFCKQTDSSGIAMFDLQLIGVTVTSEQIADVAGNVGNELAQFFRECPGFLLAWSMAVNQKADVDIFVATQKAGMPTCWLDELKASANRKKVENWGSSVPFSASQGKLGSWLWPCIKEFIGRHENCDIIDVIWQPYFRPMQSYWFTSDREGLPIPHTWTAFNRKYGSPELRAESEIGQYLRSVLVYGYGRRRKTGSQSSYLHDQFAQLNEEVRKDLDQVVQWLLTSERFWYLMQRVFGASKIWLPDKRFDQQSKAAFPGHGVLLLLLLAATGAACWERRDLPFTEPANEESKTRDGEYAIVRDDRGVNGYSTEDVVAVRGILRSVFKVFCSLVTGSDDAFSSTVSRVASLSERPGCGFFSLSVNRDAMARCKDNRDRPSLLGRTQFALREPREYGDFLNVYASFQDACEPSNGGDRGVFSWILPGARAGGWTELLVGVVARVK